MRNLILSALLLASAFQTALGAVEGQWTYIVQNGGATITASTATGAVTIPSSLGGYAVNQVGYSYSPVFGSPNSSVTRITIPNSVTSIGEYAFAYCDALDSVTIPSSVTSIGSWAFYGCGNLSSLTIPSSVTSIGSWAFQGCFSSPTYPPYSLTIPDSVTSIGEGAFAFCIGLHVYLPSRFETTYQDFGLTSSQVSFYDSTSTSYLAGQQSVINNPSAHNLYTATQHTANFNAGKDSVLNSPNSNGLYTTSQIQNMAVGDLVLTRQESGGFVLNYDIQQSEDLQNWTTYQEYALPLTNLPINKAFVRIKAIEGTQEALLDAKINSAIASINKFKYSAFNYYMRYPAFPSDGTKSTVIEGSSNAWTRTYGDGATLANIANTTFGDILISEGMLDRLMLPIGEYGYSNPVGYTASAISLAQNGVVKAKPVNTTAVNYPLILCRYYVDSSAETRLFTASANSVRIVFILIPGLSTNEVAALKTKIDGPFNNTILGASDLVAKAVAGTATGAATESVNRGNCLITTSPLAGGGYDAWVYLVHE